MRWSNLCESKAKVRETHAFCMRVEVSADFIDRLKLWERGRAIEKAVAFKRRR